MSRVRFFARWGARLLLAALALLLALQLWYLGWILYWKGHEPGPTAFQLHDLARAAEQHRPRAHRQAWVAYARISPALKRAVVASEDANFLQHGGVDWRATLEAWRENERHGHTLHGGSTITQQLAKNLFLSPRRSYLRKAQELAIALMIERVWNKHRILEVYLNVVEWGDGVYGAEAAARHYYGTGAGDLDAEQGARLAAMLPSPTVFDRNRDSAYLAERAAAILVYAPMTAIPN
jgi:monofunctional biosynthetic peptidoglycan transglycosylase